MDRKVSNLLCVSQPDMQRHAELAVQNFAYPISPANGNCQKLNFGGGTLHGVNWTRRLVGCCLLIGSHESLWNQVRSKNARAYSVFRATYTVYRTARVFFLHRTFNGCRCLARYLLFV